MKRRIPAAWVVLATWVAQAGAAGRPAVPEDDVRARLVGAGRGASLTVTLRDGSRVSGRLQDVTAEGFELRLESGASEVYRLAEVVDVWIEPRIHEATPSPTGGWSKKKTLWVAAIIAGAVVALGTIGYYNSR